jgi:hypothetical protein
MRGELAFRFSTIFGDDFQENKRGWGSGAFMYTHERISIHTWTIVLKRTLVQEIKHGTTT